MTDQLFVGSLVRLKALDPASASEAVARWELDSEYSRLESGDPAYPATARHIREVVEGEEAREGDGDNEYLFAIHGLVDDRLLGFVDVTVTHWAHGDAFLGIGIGERADWGKGYGTDAMRVMLRYAFRELNLHRVSLTVFEYNPRAIRCYQKAGFVEEGRLRGWLNREGRRWDMIHMGILREEWERLEVGD